MKAQAAGAGIVTVTVDCNGHADTLACLASLRRSECAGTSIIVVDNGSQPPLQLSPDDAGVTLIRHETNLGFARGYNAGIRAALDNGADIVFVLNNDTLVAPDMWPPLLAALREMGGMVSPRIYYAAEPQRIWSDGFRANRWTLEPRDPRRGQLDMEPAAPPQPVDYVTGCAMLVERRVFEQVGLFDEGYFAYYEDLDLCIRARRAGFIIATVPAAHLWHRVARTTGLGTPRREYLMARGSIRFYAKHAGRRMPFVLFARTASLGKRLLTLALQARGDLIRAHLSGLWEGLRDVSFSSRP